MARLLATIILNYYHGNLENTNNKKNNNNNNIYLKFSIQIILIDKYPNKFNRL